MIDPIPLTPFYRHYACVALGLCLACTAGVVLYESLVAPIPSGAGTGLSIGQLFAAGGYSAARFVKTTGRAPTEGEKLRLARVGTALSLSVSVVGILALFAYHYVMAFVVALPWSQFQYYVLRQQLVSMWLDLGAGVWILILGGSGALSLILGYWILKSTYGRNAQKLASKLSSQKVSQKRWRVGSTRL